MNPAPYAFFCGSAVHSPMPSKEGARYNAKQIVPVHLFSPNALESVHHNMADSFLSIS